jgi:hypothetical protein
MVLQLNSLAVPVSGRVRCDFLIGSRQITTESTGKGKSNTGLALADKPFIRQYSAVIYPPSGHFRKGTK